MSKEDIFDGEQIKTLIITLLLCVLLTQEAHEFLGGGLHLLLIGVGAALGFYQVIKLLYMVLIPVRGTVLRKIVPKKIREVYK